MELGWWVGPRLQRQAVPDVLSQVTDSPILAAARAATAAGLVALPVRPASKAPAVDWKGYQAERPSKTELAWWFRDGPTCDALGLLCGAISGNLMLIEYEDAETCVAAKQLLHAMGQGDLVRAIELGYSESTPGGGVHWLIRTEGTTAGNQKLAAKPCPPECTKHETGRPHVLAETRGEGGFVVVAPSAGGRDEHQSATPYRLAAGGFDSIVTVPAEALESLLSALRTLDQMPRAPVAPPRDPAFVSLTGEERPGDRYERIASWDEILVGWKRLFTHNGLTHWARPGKKERTTSATTGLRSDQGAPADLLYVFSTSTEYDDLRGYSKFAAYTQSLYNGDFSAAARALAKDSRYAKAEAVRQGIKAVNQAIAPLLADPETGEIIEPTSVSEEAPDGFVDWHRLWTEEHVSEDWLIEPLLPRGRGVAMYSKAKAGKSLLALDVCVRASMGLPIFGRTYPRMKVAYIDKEMTEADLRERLEEMGYNGSEDWSHLFYHQLGALPPLDTPAGGITLLSKVQEVEAELVVIDTMSRVLHGEENDADTMRNFYLHTGMALKGAGITLWRLDHSGKNDDMGQRGSSAKNDDVDLVWQLKASDDLISLTATHRRQGWVPEKVTFRREDDPLRHEIFEDDEGWPVGTRDLANKLEHLGVDSSWSRPRARALLKEEDVKVNNGLLSAALRFLRRSEHDPASIIYEVVK